MLPSLLKSYVLALSLKQGLTMCLLLIVLGLGLAERVAAASSSPVLATANFEGTPVTANYGDLTVRLTAGVEPKNEDPTEAVAEVASPAGTIRLAISDENGPDSEVRIVRLAAGPEPQVLFQRAANGSAACVKSKLAVLINDAWRAIDLDRICEAEEGYEVVDPAGDGTGVLVSRVEYFLPFEEHAHEGTGPIRIQGVVGGRLVVVTGSARYRDYLRKSMPPAPEAGERNRLQAAIWMASETLLGERASAWSHMVQLFRLDRTVFTVCAVREASSGVCPQGRQREAPYLEALATLLVANGYVADMSQLPIPELH